MSFPNRESGLGGAVIHAPMFCVPLSIPSSWTGITRREVRKPPTNRRYRTRGFPSRHETLRRVWSARTSTQPCERFGLHESVHGTNQPLRAFHEECGLHCLHAREVHPTLR